MKKMVALFGLAIIASCASDTSLEDFKSSAIIYDQNAVMAYFPPDVLSAKRMEEIVDTINLGIDLTYNLIGGPLEWQLFKDKQIIYYFMPGWFVSHTTKSGEIEIPIIWYEKYGKSPWLHETIHIMQRTKTGFWRPKKISSFFKMPEWLTEGSAEYLSMIISHDHSIPKPDFFNSGGIEKVDSVCNTSLKNKNGIQILGHIGKPGVFVKLHGRKRDEYAPTYYNCSCSFTKYLAETYGIDLVLNAISNFKKEHQTIEELTGQSMNKLKEDWLISIGQKQIDVNNKKV